MLNAFVMLASETPTTPTGMDSMLQTMKTVLSFSMGIFYTVTGNPIMSFILAGSLVGVGIAVLRQVKGVASA